MGCQAFGDDFDRPESRGSLDRPASRSGGGSGRPESRGGGGPVGGRAPRGRSSRRGPSNIGQL